MKLSLVVPVYNEAPALEEVVRYLMSIPFPIETEWIFVDDCSKDNSLSILKQLQKEFRFTLIEQNPNQGKGAALIRGFEKATGDFIIVQDADFEYDPTDIPNIISPLIEEKADVVYGSRFKKNSEQVHRTYHYFVNRFLTAMSNLLSGLYLTDMETCYKAFRADLLKSMRLTSQRFGIEVEMTAFVAKTSARVYEVPIHYYPRTQLQGKKINWKDGVAALWHLVRFNLLIDKDEAFVQLPEHYRTRILRRPKGAKALVSQRSTVAPTSAAADTTRFELHQKQ